MNKKTAVKNNKTPAQLEYRDCNDGNLHLFNKSIDTGIMIKRSHEGYNHFACWYVTDNGKIKKDYPIKEKEAALAKGKSVYLEKLSNSILKTRGGGNE